MRTDSKIEFREVTKRFGETVALEKLDLSIAEGETLCLLGPSGCGKTTALDILAGFEEPTDGEVVIDGKPVRKPGPDRSVVFQAAGLFPWMTVWQNVTLGPRSRGLKDFEERAADLLSAVGLEKFRKHYPYQLSGGMKQRVAIARALVSEPDVLLMDEPFGALDAQTRLSMQLLLLDIVERFKPTILFVTHDVDEAIFLGDRLALLCPRPGRLQDCVDVDISRPRSVEDLTTSEFNVIKRRLLGEMRSVGPVASIDA